jgi:hypothetical protein
MALARQEGEIAMQRLVKAGIAGVLLAAATSSASAVEVWQGHLFITTASNGCNASNWAVNQFFNAVLRPNDLEDNGPFTLLALFRDRYAARYRFGGALAGNGTYDGRHITSTATVGSTGSFSGNYSKGSVKPVPAVGKPSLKVRVKLTGFGDNANCAVTLEGTLGLRPNL